MSKPIKELIVATLSKTYEGVEGICVVDLSGLDVKAQQAIRGRLRERSAKLQVVKNSLARRAFEGTTLEPIGNALRGPCALVVSSESLIEAAKVLVEAAEEFKELTLKQAMIEGGPDLLSVSELSKMKGRTELLGEVAMLISSPARSLAGCLSAPQAKIAGCLKAMIDKAA